MNRLAVTARSQLRTAYDKSSLNTRRKQEGNKL